MHFSNHVKNFVLVELNLEVETSSVVIKLTFYHYKFGLIPDAGMRDEGVTSLFFSTK